MDLDYRAYLKEKGFTDDEIPQEFTEEQKAELDRRIVGETFQHYFQQAKASDPTLTKGQAEDAARKSVAEKYPEARRYLGLWDKPMTAKEVTDIGMLLPFMKDLGIDPSDPSFDPGSFELKSNPTIESYVDKLAEAVLDKKTTKYNVPELADDDGKPISKDEFRRMFYRNTGLANIDSVQTYLERLRTSAGEELDKQKPSGLIATFKQAGRSTVKLAGNTLGYLGMRLSQEADVDEASVAGSVGDSIQNLGANLAKWGERSMIEANHVRYFNKNIADYDGFKKLLAFGEDALLNIGSAVPQVAAAASLATEGLLTRGGKVAKGAKIATTLKGLNAVGGGLALASAGLSVGDVLDDLRTHGLYDPADAGIYANYVGRVVAYDFMMTAALAGTIKVGTAGIKKLKAQRKSVLDEARANGVSADEVENIAARMNIAKRIGAGSPQARAILKSRLGGAAKFGVGATATAVLGESVPEGWQELEAINLQSEVAGARLPSGEHPDFFQGFGLVAKESAYNVLSGLGWDTLAQNVDPETGDLSLQGGRIQIPERMRKDRYWRAFGSAGLMGAGTYAYSGVSTALQRNWNEKNFENLTYQLDETGTRRTVRIEEARNRRDFNIQAGLAKQAGIPEPWLGGVLGQVDDEGNYYASFENITGRGKTPLEALFNLNTLANEGTQSLDINTVEQTEDKKGVRIKLWNDQYLTVKGENALDEMRSLIEMHNSAQTPVRIQSGATITVDSKKKRKYTIEMEIGGQKRSMTSERLIDPYALFNPDLHRGSVSGSIFFQEEDRATQGVDIPVRVGQYEGSKVGFVDDDIRTSLQTNPNWQILNWDENLRLSSPSSENFTPSLGKIAPSKMRILDVPGRIIYTVTIDRAKNNNNAHALVEAHYLGNKKQKVRLNPSIAKQVLRDSSNSSAPVATSIRLEAPVYGVETTKEEVAGKTVYGLSDESIQSLAKRVGGEIVAESKNSVTIRTQVFTRDQQTNQLQRKNVEFTVNVNKDTGEITGVADGKPVNIRGIAGNPSVDVNAPAESVNVYSAALMGRRPVYSRIDDEGNMRLRISEDMFGGIQEIIVDRNGNVVNVEYFLDENQYQNFIDIERERLERVNAERERVKQAKKKRSRKTQGTQAGTDSQAVQTIQDETEETQQVEQTEQTEAQEEVLENIDNNRTDVASVTDQQEFIFDLNNYVGAIQEQIVNATTIDELKQIFGNRIQVEYFYRDRNNISLITGTELSKTDNLEDAFTKAREMYQNGMVYARLILMDKFGRRHRDYSGRVHISNVRMNEDGTFSDEPFHSHMLSGSEDNLTQFKDYIKSDAFLKDQVLSDPAQRTIIEEFFKHRQEEKNNQTVVDSRQTRRGTSDKTLRKRYAGLPYVMRTVIRARKRTDAGETFDLYATKDGRWSDNRNDPDIYFTDEEAQNILNNLNNVDLEGLGQAQLVGYAVLFSYDGNEVLGSAHADDEQGLAQLAQISNDPENIDKLVADEDVQESETPMSDEMESRTGFGNFLRDYYGETLPLTDGRVVRPQSNPNTYLELERYSDAFGNEKLNYIDFHYFRRTGFVVLADKRNQRSRGTITLELLLRAPVTTTLALATGRLRIFATQREFLESEGKEVHRNEVLSYARNHIGRENATEDELWAWIEESRTLAEHADSVIANVYQGDYDGDTGIISIVGDYIPWGYAAGVLHHEMGVHARKKMDGTQMEDLEELIRQMNEAKADMESELGAAIRMTEIAHRNVLIPTKRDRGQRVHDEELLSYFVADNFKDYGLAWQAGEFFRNLFVATDTIRGDAKQLSIGEIVSIARGFAREAARTAPSRNSNRGQRAMSMTTAQQAHGVTESKLASQMREVERYYQRPENAHRYLMVKNDEGELVPTNLTPQQWLFVRTPIFKRWFGDWELDPARASKVLDENGEPMVLWHDTRNDYLMWDAPFIASNTRLNFYDQMFLGDSVQDTEEHLREAARHEAKAHSVGLFLNARRPLRGDDTATIRRYAEAIGLGRTPALDIDALSDMDALPAEATTLIELFKLQRDRNIQEFLDENSALVQMAAPAGMSTMSAQRFFEGLLKANLRPLSNPLVARPTTTVTPEAVEVFRQYTDQFSGLLLELAHNEDGYFEGTWVRDTLNRYVEDGAYQYEALRDALDGVLMELRDPQMLTALVNNAMHELRQEEFERILGVPIPLREEIPLFTVRDLNQEQSLRLRDLMERDGFDAFVDNFDSVVLYPEQTKPANDEMLGDAVRRNPNTLNAESQAIASARAHNLDEVDVRVLVSLDDALTQDANRLGVPYEQLRGEYWGIYRNKRHDLNWMRRTNLDEYSWVMVRTPTFKRMYGDWEKAIDGHMILDENREPVRMTPITKRTYGLAGTNEESVFLIDPIVNEDGTFTVRNSEQVLRLNNTFSTKQKNPDRHLFSYMSFDAAQRVLAAEQMFKIPQVYLANRRAAAERYRQLGLSDEFILKRTGWQYYRGQWMYEHINRDISVIDSNDAFVAGLDIERDIFTEKVKEGKYRLLEIKRAKDAKNNAEFTRLRNDFLVNYDPNLNFSIFSPGDHLIRELFEIAEEISIPIAAIRTKFISINPNTQERTFVRLNQIYKDNDLYTAYPELQNAEVYIGNADPQRVGGSFDPLTKRLNLPEDFFEYDRERQERIMLHETQHWIDDHEGWGLKGSLEDLFVQETDFRVDKVLDTFANIYTDIESHIQESEKNNFKILFNNGRYEELHSQLEEYFSTRQIDPSLRKNLDEMQVLIRVLNMPYDWYLSTVGEILARAAENHARRESTAIAQEFRNAFPHLKEHYNDDFFLNFNLNINASYAARFFGVSNKYFSQVIPPQTLQSEYEAVAAQYRGTDQWLKAPNGENTRLTERQWVLVRTPRFKAWFGDWENDPAGASKALDANGEPLVLYHGSPVEDLEVFRNQSEIEGSERGYRGTGDAGLYFTPRRSYAERYTSADLASETSGGRVYEMFLNMRNPARLRDLGWTRVDKITLEQAQQLRDQGYDGVIFDHKKRPEYVVLDSEQVKSATENTGAFGINEQNTLYSQTNLGANLTQNDIDAISDEEIAEADNHLYSIVTAQNEIDAFNERIREFGTVSGPLFRAMVTYDGINLYPPMAEVIEGKRDPVRLGDIQRADENPQLVWRSGPNKGKFPLKKFGSNKRVPAVYAPFIHSSLSPLNDQFTIAYKRPLVTVRMEIPADEIPASPEAADAMVSETTRELTPRRPGMTEWKAGVVNSKLLNGRQVMLSREARVAEIVPDADIADLIVADIRKAEEEVKKLKAAGKKLKKGMTETISMPINVVTPTLLRELVLRGIPVAPVAGNIAEEDRLMLDEAVKDIKKNGIKAAYFTEANPYWQRQEAIRRAQPRGVQKEADTAYPNAAEELRNLMFSLSTPRRAKYSNALIKSRPDFTSEQREAILDELDRYGTEKKPDILKERATLHWIITGAIAVPNPMTTERRIGDFPDEDPTWIEDYSEYIDRGPYYYEDEYKVNRALDAAKKYKVDPLNYDSPLELIEAYERYRIGFPRINPDDVPELSNPVDVGDGIVTYDVQDDEQGQQAMREIINSHLGKNWSNWCLLRADNQGRLVDNAWYFWSRKYNKLPKKVAFKNGRLISFMATDEDTESQAFTLEEGLSRYKESIRRRWNEYDFRSTLPAEASQILDSMEELIGIDSVLEDILFILTDRINNNRRGTDIGDVVDYLNNYLNDELLDKLERFIVDGENSISENERTVLIEILNTAYNDIVTDSDVLEDYWNDWVDNYSFIIHNIEEGVRKISDWNNRFIQFNLSPYSDFEFVDNIEEGTPFFRQADGIYRDALSLSPPSQKWWDRSDKARPNLDWARHSNLFSQAQANPSIAENIAEIHQAANEAVDVENSRGAKLMSDGTIFVDPEETGRDYNRVRNYAIVRTAKDELKHDDAIGTQLALVRDWERSNDPVRRNLLHRAQEMMRNAGQEDSKLLSYILRAMIEQGVESRLTDDVTSPENVQARLVGALKNVVMRTTNSRRENVQMTPEIALSTANAMLNLDNESLEEMVGQISEEQAEMFAPRENAPFMEFVMGDIADMLSMYDNLETVMIDGQPAIVTGDGSSVLRLGTNPLYARNVIERFMESTTDHSVYEDGKPLEKRDDFDLSPLAQYISKLPEGSQLGSLATEADVTKFLENNIPKHIRDRIEVVYTETAEAKQIFKNNTYNGVFFPRSSSQKIIYVKAYGRNLGDVIGTIAHEVSHFGWAAWMNQDMVELIVNIYDALESNIKATLPQYWNKMTKNGQYPYLSRDQKMILVNEFLAYHNTNLYELSALGHTSALSQDEADMVQDVRDRVASEINKIELRMAKGFQEDYAKNADAVRHYVETLLRMTMAPFHGRGVHLEYKLKNTGMEGQQGLPGDDRTDIYDQIIVYTNDFGQVYEPTPISPEARINRALADKYAKLPRLWKAVLLFKWRNLKIPGKVYGDTILGMRNTVLLQRAWKAIDEKNNVELRALNDDYQDFQRILRENHGIDANEITMGKGYVQTLQDRNITDKKLLERAKIYDEFLKIANQRIFQNVIQIRNNIREHADRLEYWMRLQNVQEKEIASMRRKMEAFTQRFVTDWEHRRYAAYTEEDLDNLTEMMRILTTDNATKNEAYFSDMVEDKRKELEEKETQFRAGQLNEKLYAKEKEKLETIINTYERLVALFRWVDQEYTAKHLNADPNINDPQDLKNERNRYAEVNQGMRDTVQSHITAIEKEDDRHILETRLAFISALHPRKLDENDAHDALKMRFLDPINDPVLSMLHSLDQQQKVLAKLAFNLEFGEALLQGGMAWMRGAREHAAFGDTTLTWMENGSFLQYVVVDPFFMEEIKNEQSIQEKIRHQIWGGLTDIVKANKTVYNTRMAVSNYISNISVNFMTGHLMNTENWKKAYSLSQRKFMDTVFFSAEKEIKKLIEQGDNVSVERVADVLLRQYNDEIRKLDDEMETLRVWGGSISNSQMMLYARGTHEKAVAMVTEFMRMMGMNRSTKNAIDNAVAKYLTMGREFYGFGDEWGKPLTYLNNRAVMLAKYKAAYNWSQYENPQNELEQARADEIAREIEEKAVRDAALLTMRETTTWELAPNLIRQAARAQIRFWMPDFLLHNFQMFRIMVSVNSRMKEAAGELGKLRANENRTADEEMYMNLLKNEMIHRRVGWYGTMSAYAAMTFGATSVIPAMTAFVGSLLSGGPSEDELKRRARGERDPNDGSSLSIEEWEALSRICASKARTGDLFMPWPFGWVRGKEGKEFYAINWHRVHAALTHAVPKMPTEENGGLGTVGDWIRYMIANNLWSGEEGSIAMQLYKLTLGRDRHDKPVTFGEAMKIFAGMVLVPETMNTLYKNAMGIRALGADEGEMPWYQERKYHELSFFDWAGTRVVRWNVDDFIESMGYKMRQLSDNRINAVRKNLIFQLRNNPDLTDREITSLVRDIVDMNRHEMARMQFDLKTVRDFLHVDPDRLRKRLTEARNAGKLTMSKDSAEWFLAGRDVLSLLLINTLKNEIKALNNIPGDSNVSSQEVKRAIGNFEKAVEKLTALAGETDRIPKERRGTARRWQKDSEQAMKEREERMEKVAVRQASGEFLPGDLLRYQEMVVDPNEKIVVRDDRVEDITDEGLQLKPGYRKAKAKWVIDIEGFLQNKFGDQIDTPVDGMTYRQYKEKLEKILAEHGYKDGQILTDKEGDKLNREAGGQRVSIREARKKL